MPRALLHTMGVSDQHMHRGAAALEAGSLSYVIATDTFNTGQPIIVRCAIGTAVWFVYERFLLGTLN